MLLSWPDPAGGLSVSACGRYSVLVSAKRSVCRENDTTLIIIMSYTLMSTFPVINYYHRRLCVIPYILFTCVLYVLYVIVSHIGIMHMRLCITHIHHFLHACILITSCMHACILIISCTSAGDLPYSELGNTVLLPRVMAGYRLDCPQGCPENMYGYT